MLLFAIVGIGCEFLLSRTKNEIVETVCLIVMYAYIVCFFTLLIIGLVILILTL